MQIVIVIMHALISIHALLAESDSIKPIFCKINTNFYPRSPCGERPRVARTPTTVVTISIHALLAESDTQSPPSVTPTANFYPRSPCGERQLYINRTAKTVVFLSTLSLRRATKNALRQIVDRGISIHALLAESDGGSGVGSWPRVIFLSTLSLRRATRRAALLLELYDNFYPRSPCGERPRPRPP